MINRNRLKIIDKRIARIKESLASIEGMRPGSLTKQYRNPGNQTGAHYQISYTHEMKSRTEHVRRGHVKEIREQIKNYKKYKKLNTEWVSLSIERSKLVISLANEQD
jgi:hypothetical protein